MRYDQIALERAQRHAYKTLKAGTKGAFANINPASITVPVTIIQELDLLATKSEFKFEYGSRAPLTSPASAITPANNVIFGDNDVFCFYGVQLFQGVGQTLSNRQYFSHGVTTDDDAIYNGELSVKFETDESINLFQTRNFKETGPIENFSGFQFVNPLRIVAGRLGKLQFTLSYQEDFSTLTFTPNSVISLRIHGGLGQPGGGSN